ARSRRPTTWFASSGASPTDPPRSEFHRRRVHLRLLISTEINRRTLPKIRPENAMTARQIINNEFKRSGGQIFLGAEKARLWLLPNPKESDLFRGGPGGRGVLCLISAEINRRRLPKSDPENARTARQISQQ